MKEFCHVFLDGYTFISDSPKLWELTKFRLESAHGRLLYSRRTK